MISNTSGQDLRALSTGFAKITTTSGAFSTQAAILEADQTLADNTTNNATTARHGYLLKLDNDSTHFMNGQGAWAVPAGSGGGIAASGSAAIDFASIPDGGCVANTFTVTGALTTDYVAPRVPTLTAGIEWAYRVSASDTVTVQLCNLSGAAIDLGSLTYGAAVLR